MAVVVDSGPISATDKFDRTPRKKWEDLMRAKRSFLKVNIKYDCRCLVEFVEEAQQVWQEIGFASAEEMIREGYELDSAEIDLAVTWLKLHEPGEAVGLDEVAAKVQAARANPLAEHGEVGNGRESRIDNVNSTEGGNSQTYLLRRLARDGRNDLLDAIAAGEISTHAAAIKAGIRKVPTPLKVIQAAWKKASAAERRAIRKWVSDND